MRGIGHSSRIALAAASIVGLLAACLTRSEEAVARQSQALAGSDKLFEGESLSPGQSLTAGAATLIYQHDNNLVLYDNGQAIWASGTDGTDAPGRFEMQGDCNAVVYGASGGAVWASGTNGSATGCFVHLYDNDGLPNWAIDTTSGTRVFMAIHYPSDPEEPPPEETYMVGESHISDPNTCNLTEGQNVSYQRCEDCGCDPDQETLVCWCAFL